MTPQLQQAIKLLQLSRLELAAVGVPGTDGEPGPRGAAARSRGRGAGSGRRTRLRSGDCRKRCRSSAPEPEVTGELKNDLELGPQWDEYLNEMGDGRDYGNAEADDKELPSYDQTLTRLPSLSDHLQWQLHLSTSDPALVKGGEWIIGNLDDDGYLRATLEELAQQSGVSPADMERALELIQSFDPAGDRGPYLQECLLIQVRHLDLQGTLVEKIVQDHLADLEKRHYPQIAKVLKVTPQEVMEASQIIIHELEPKPGQALSRTPIPITWFPTSMWSRWRTTT